MIPGITCASCCFFSPPLSPNPRNPRGQCRRYAPVFDQQNGEPPRTIWPLVRDDSWCGEHATAEDQD